MDESAQAQETSFKADQEEKWILYVDGSSSSINLRVDLILTNIEGDVVQYTLNFEFLATNNETEYETLIVSLKMAKEVGVQLLVMFSDYKLMVGQVKDEYEAWKEKYEEVS